jgi:hypothetical protein
MGSEVISQPGRQTNEKAGLDGKRCAHVEATRSQKDASGKNRANLEEDRGRNAAKGSYYWIVTRFALLTLKRTAPLTCP